jgi:lipoprotein-anchoring transpeptidase ErfK/SrfK
MSPNQTDGWKLDEPEPAAGGWKLDEPGPGLTKKPQPAASPPEVRTPAAPVNSPPVTTRNVTRLDMGERPTAPVRPSFTPVPDARIVLPPEPPVKNTPEPPVPSTPTPHIAPAPQTELLHSVIPKALLDYPAPVAHTVISGKLPFTGPPDSAQVKVTVSLPDKKVIVQDASGKVLRQFPAIIGAPGTPTPVGQFKIIEDEKLEPSEWYYGGHYIAFNRHLDKDKKTIDSEGFHGWTYGKDDDEEEKVNPGWKTTTHGCVQLSNRDIADFAALVRAGDSVTIVGRQDGRR